MKTDPKVKKLVRNKALAVALLPVLKRARRMTKDLCRSSCDVPGHEAVCVADKAEDRRAFKALKQLQ